MCMHVCDGVGGHIHKEGGGERERESLTLYPTDLIFMTIFLTFKYWDPGHQPPQSAQAVSLFLQI